MTYKYSLLTDEKATTGGSSNVYRPHNVVNTSYTGGRAVWEHRRSTRIFPGSYPDLL